ncbi:DUF3008 family protein [Paracoccus sp. (in: a-proteobacteria)]|uniref:DUF3008 family protein n=1 Tax=Paracoccus sp. TaxID=267 RepID=UPI0035B46441
MKGSSQNAQRKICQSSAKVKDLKGASKDMHDSMDERQLEELAGSSRKGKPEHVGKG